MTSARGRESAAPGAVSGGMRKISLIAVHCSATRSNSAFSAADLKRDHLLAKSKGGRGFNDVGYHFIIERDGRIVAGRPVATPGAHIVGHNSASIGICYIGGLDASAKPTDTRTPAQIASLTKLLAEQRRLYPDAKIRGHRDLSPDLDRDGKVEPHEWLKICPCFDVAAWCRSVGIDPK